VAYQEFQFGNKNTTTRVTRISSVLLDVIRDLDTLLGTDVNYMVGVWIAMARSWGTTAAEVRWEKLETECARNGEVVRSPRPNLSDCADPPPL
jgi:hypothetical protein